MKPKTKPKKSGFLSIPPDLPRIFAREVLEDLKLYLFLTALVMLYRAAFIFYFKALLPSPLPWGEIITACWLGLKLSSKYIFYMTLPAFVFATLPKLLKASWPAAKIRFWLACILIVLLSLLFQARLPYYMEFGTTFNYFLFNTANDDPAAILKAAIDAYHAHWRFLAGLAFAAAFIWIYRKFTILTLPQKWQNKPAFALVLALVLAMVSFISLSGKTTLLNYAALSQPLLNEAIPDDIAALHNAADKYYAGQQKRRELGEFVITPAKVRSAAEYLTGKPYEEKTLDTFLTKTARGAKIKKPSHIFVIIAESYMLWPLLENYDYLPVAGGMKNILKQKDAVLYTRFIPTSMATVSAVRSTLSAVPEYLNHPEGNAYIKQNYPPGIARVFKELGYKTNFFYGGFPSWEGMDTLTAAHGFDNVFFKGDFENAPAGLWGMDDGPFLQGVLGKLAKQGQAPSLNIILTLSNHSPFKVDLDKEEGLNPAQKYREILPDAYKKDKLLIRKLRHFEYADKHLAAFIQAARAKYPDSLFLIVGDHSERYHINPAAGLYETTAVPLILIGHGINENIFNKDTAGSHYNIMPTLVELIAPRGFRYKSFGGDLLQTSKTGLHYSKVLTADFIVSEGDKQSAQPLPSKSAPSHGAVEAALKNSDQSYIIYSWIENRGLILEE